MSDQNQQPEKTSEPVTPQSRKEPELSSEKGRRDAEAMWEAMQNLHLPRKKKDQ